MERLPYLRPVMLVGLLTASRGRTVSGAAESTDENKSGINARPSANGAQRRSRWSALPHPPGSFRRAPAGLRSHLDGDRMSLFRSPSPLGIGPGELTSKEKTDVTQPRRRPGTY